MKNFKILLVVLALLAGGINVFANGVTSRNSMISIDNNSQGGGKYGADSVACITNLSLYQEYFKQWKSTDYTGNAVLDALVPWRKVFFSCPKASQNMYLDGLKMMNYKFEKAPDNQKDAYMDTIKMVYLQRLENFPTKGTQNMKGEIYGRLGVDMMTLTPDRCEEAYGFLKESIALEQDNASVSSLVYYFRATIKKVKNGKAEESSVVDTYDELSSLIESNIEKNANNPKVLAQWQNAQGSIESTFEPYATCDALVGIYAKKFADNNSDISLLKKITKILKKKKCTSSELFFGATEKLYQLEPTPSSAILMGKMLIEKEKYTEASKYLEEAVGMLETPKEKADVLSDLAKIYYKLNQLSKSRSYARQSLELNPADGMLYIMIGDMYAASASECGGNEFSSKAAYWAAVDKYVQARNADSSIAELANSRIATYSKYFPTTETIFFHDHKEGDSYSLDCWIGETTTIRAAK
jgi:tetratricopeptide (TPR) repeat protein